MAWFELDDYVGSYYSEDVGESPIVLRHSAGRRFLGGYPLLGVAFERDSDGNVTR